MNSKLLQSLALIFPLSLAVTQQAFGSIAGSDTFAAATVISSENDISLPTSLLSYTSEAGEPGHSPTGTAGAQKSAWWSWTATENGFCTVDTLLSAKADAPATDTLIAVYTGTSVAGLTRIGANDDDSFANSYLSSTSFYALQGVTYKIAVDGYGSGSITSTHCNVELRLRLLPLRILSRAATFVASTTGPEMGIATMTSTATGSLSGKLTVGTKAYPFAGAFGQDGFYYASFPVAHPVNTPPPLPITLQIDGAGSGYLNVEIGNDIAKVAFPEKCVFTPGSPNTVAGLYPCYMSPTGPYGGLGVLSFTVGTSGWDPLESTCRHASLSIL